MKGLNKVQLIGNLGKDPEIRHTPGGKKVATFTMAVNREYKDQEGKTIDDTQWFNIEAWTGLADIIEKYLTKGSRVFIEGRLRTKKYQKNGDTKYFTKVVAREMIMLGDPTSTDEFDEDDIPF